MEGTTEIAAVQEALAAGRLTVPDAETGFHHPIYAVCPNDGQHVMVRRVVRGARGAITEVIARCPQCGTQFTAEPHQLHLR